MLSRSQRPRLGEWKVKLPHSSRWVHWEPRPGVDSSKSNIKFSWNGIWSGEKKEITYNSNIEWTTTEPDSVCIESCTTLPGRRIKLLTRRDTRKRRDWRRQTISRKRRLKRNNLRNKKISFLKNLRRLRNPRTRPEPSRPLCRNN